MKTKLPKYSASNPRGFRYYHFPDVTEKIGSQTNVDLPRCERCGATLLLFDKHKCGELEYPAYHLLDVTEKVEESKLNTLSSDFGHKDILPETNEANSVMISAEIVKLMLEDAKLEERQRVVETLKKIGIVDEETGTITFSYNELFDSLEPK